MININKIKIYVAEFTSENQLVSIDMFDISAVLANYFIGLSIESPNIVDEFTDFERWRTYDLLDIDDIDNPSFNQITEIIKNYTGVHMTLDEVVNLMLDGDEFPYDFGVHVNRDKFCREIYLRSVIYYKTNQLGKKKHKHQIKVKHYDDFHHQFSEDIISTQVLENNDDFSESIILIETYLTINELNGKFREYIIV